MARPSPLPSVATVGAVAVAVAVLFAGAVIWFTRILPAINDRPVQVSTAALAAPVTAAEADRWSGVAQLTGGATCTAVLVDTGTETGPGYLLTAGHCGPARELDANAVITNQASESTATFRLVPGRDPVAVGVDRVMYSSMKGTDVSVLRLDATLGELRERGLRPYAFAPVDPGSGAEVTNVAVPADGVSEQVLRAGSCRLGPTADLVESSWLFDEMVSDNCPGAVGGSSGSPLFDGADDLVGMVTTTTVDSAPGGACALDTPCERTGGGVMVQPDTSYGVPAAALQGCFVNGSFGLGASCPLPTASLTFVLGQTVFAPAALAEQGSQVSVRVVAGRSTAVVAGVAPLTDRSSCTDPAVYTTVGQAGPSGEPIQAALPATEGFYLLCATTRGADGRPELARPAAAVFQVDATPPVQTPVLSVRPTSGGLSVEAVASAPELVDFRIKIGPPASTDCAMETGYQPYRGVPLQVRSDQLPAVVCVLGADHAGNAARPWSQVLTP